MLLGIFRGVRVRISKVIRTLVLTVRITSVIRTLVAPDHTCLCVRECQVLTGFSHFCEKVGFSGAAPEPAQF